MPKPVYLFAVLSLAACSSEQTPDQQGLAEGQWRDGKGGGLCVSKDGSAALILYGEEGASCMAQGRIVSDDGALLLAPRGDQACRIGLVEDGDTVRFEGGGQSCSYYCGGGTELAGRTVRRSEATAEPLKDIAGDPIC